MDDAVFEKLFTHLFFYLVGVAVGDDVHCRTTAYSVDAPQMQVVDIVDAVNLQDAVHHHLKLANGVNREVDGTYCNAVDVLGA